jgi:Domain of unknown function (DUF4389)
VNIHPVQFHVQSLPLRRVHVFLRLGVIAVLSVVGCSSAYWLVYLVLPVLAALLLSRDGARGYLDRDASTGIRIIRWFAGAYAYLWLLTDALPTTGAQTPVELTIETHGDPTPSSALWRLVTSLPALFLLVLMSMVATILWVVGCISVLATERVPAPITDFIALKLRYQFRIIAYHLSLVDAYPAVTDTPQPHVPRTRTA